SLTATASIKLASSSGARELFTRRDTGQHCTMAFAGGFRRASPDERRVGIRGRPEVSQRIVSSGERRAQAGDIELLGEEVAMQVIALRGVPAYDRGAVAGHVDGVVAGRAVDDHGVGLAVAPVSQNRRD